MSYVLGIDLGSSSLKGIVMNQKGEVVAEQSKSYPMYSPKVGYSEQNPGDWIQACEFVLNKLLKQLSDFRDELVGISFSGQMHSLVILDKEHQVLYPSILWNDVRTTNECQMITNTFGKEIQEITKNKAIEGFTLPKILWLQENEPDIWEQVSKLMLPKDYLSYWFTGNITTEFSDAAGTLLLDVKEKKWSQLILDKFSISEKKLPPLVESLSQVGIVRQEICERYQFKKEIKVFAGGADNACAALGAGLLEENLALVSIGTSGVVSTFEKEIVNYNGRLHFFNHVLPSCYYSMGVTLAAGNSLNWFKRTFAKEQTFTELLSDINQIDSSDSNLYFTPYIVGERTPHFDSQIRGSFIGIDTQHELSNFTKAVLEGITFSLQDSKKLIEQSRNEPIKQLISVGGGAKSKKWLQIQADIFDATISQLKIEQGPGLGACIIAALGCQWFPDAKTAIESCISYQEEKYYPQASYVKKYQKIYLKWKKIYKQTKLIMNEEEGE